MIRNVINYIKSYFNRYFIDMNNIDKLEEEFQRNYHNIVEDDVLLNSYFERVVNVFNNTCVNDLNYEKIHDFNFRYVEYILNKWYIISFIRKAYLSIIFIKFLKDHKEEFERFGIEHDVDVDVIINGDFTSKDGWDKKEYNIMNKKIMGDLNITKFYKLIIIFEKLVVEAEERYNIISWDGLIIRIV
jgi:GR25 family glycosyltransferase involved in LPS biosynthesis